MRVRLTNASLGLELEALLSESISEGNDQVTTSSEGRAEGPTADHAGDINPYLKCNPLGTVNINTVQRTSCSRSAAPVVLQTKQCARCGEPKGLTEFYRRKASADGLQAYCKQCHKRQATEWRVSNPDEWKQIAARSRARR